MKQPSQPLERVAYGMAEAAEAMGISSTLMSQLVYGNKIPTFRVGKRRLIRKSDLIEVVDKIFAEQH